MATRKRSKRVLLKPLAILGGLALFLGVVWASTAFHDPIHDLAVTPADLTVLGADAASNAKPNAGEAYVIFGSTTLGGTLDLATTPPDLTILGADAGDFLGVSVAAGDVNGDGVEDLLVGATGADAASNAKPNAGEAYVIFGSTTLGGTLDLATTPPDLTILGADAGDFLGVSVAAGDVNGDGVEDLLVGATGADAAGNAKPDAGEVYVIFGSTTLGGTLDLATTAADLTVLGADSGDILVS